MKSSYQAPAEAAGWFRTKTAHVAFRHAHARQVCRHLKAGEVYQPDTDSLVSSPLRHASSWKEACQMDGLK